MLALVILGIVLVYLLVAIATTLGVLRLARVADASRATRWAIGGVVALIFYLIPFWDWIPTVLAHQYLCRIEAKFQIRKTVEQWKAENKDVLGTLRYDRDAKIANVGGYYRFPLNQRLASESKDAVPVFLAIKRKEGRIIDMENGEILAQYVDFIAGYGSFSVGGESGWKFWLDMGPCKGESRGRGSFELIRQEIKNLGGDK